MTPAALLAMEAAKLMVDIGNKLYQIWQINKLKERAESITLSQTKAELARILAQQPGPLEQAWHRDFEVKAP